MPNRIRTGDAALKRESPVNRLNGQYPIQPTRISVTYPGGGTSAPVVVHSPAIGDESSTPRFLPIRSIGPRQSDVLLPAKDMLAGLDAIPGRRGMDLVRERAAGHCTAGCTWRCPACWQQLRRRLGSP